MTRREELARMVVHLSGYPWQVHGGRVTGDYHGFLLSALCYVTAQSMEVSVSLHAHERSRLFVTRRIRRPNGQQGAVQGMVHELNAMLAVMEAELRTDIEAVRQQEQRETEMRARRNILLKQLSTLGPKMMVDGQRGSAAVRVGRFTVTVSPVLPEGRYEVFLNTEAELSDLKSLVDSLK